VMEKKDKVEAAHQIKEEEYEKKVVGIIIE
jgi:hypothetical protein